MSNATPLDAIRNALAPVGALRGEQSRLATWVRDSVAALESLHAELEAWQRELTRQQAVLDQRDAAAAEADAADRDATSTIAAITERLDQTKEELRVLEDENAEQLRTLGDLERQLAAASAELRSQRKHAQELTVALEAERRRALDEHRQVAVELKDVKRLLERHGALLETISDAVDRHDGPGRGVGAVAEVAIDADPDECPAEDVDGLAARAAELRRRASSRLANRRQQA